MTSEPRTVLTVRGARKSFAGVRALRGLDLDLRAGEIHALVGGNGSGKSTLIKILAGVYEADEGTAEIAGREWDLSRFRPADSRSCGLRFVHQDLGIFSVLSVAENLAIGEGFPRGAGGRINWKRCRESARRTLERFRIEVSPDARAATLSTPQQAMVAIARALQSIDEDQRGILVLDEPTASLPPDEASLLLDHMRALKEHGHTVLLVTHRLDEVQRVADRVTGVREGESAGTIEASTMTESDLVQLILGRRLEEAHIRGETPVGEEPLLEVRGLSGGPLRGVDLALRPGEVLGIAGLLGSGRTELLQMIFGVRPRSGGEILMRGEARDVSPRGMRETGVAFVPENRQEEAVFPDHSVEENVTAASLRRYFKSAWLRDRVLRRDVKGSMARFHVKAASPQVKIETLSGGNQQKVILARWLRDDPQLILLDEPTQGIDVGAREEIFALIAEATAAGAGVLLVSSELEELTRLSHRILVLSGGRIAGEMAAQSRTHDVLQLVLEKARSEGT